MKALFKGLVRCGLIIIYVISKLIATISEVIAESAQAIAKKLDK